MKKVKVRRVKGVPKPRPSLPVPDGWRLLRKGEIIRTGDRFPLMGGWIDTNNPGLRAGSASAVSFYIRRVPAKRGRKGAK